MPFAPEQWAATEGSTAREDRTEAMLRVKQGWDRGEPRQEPAGEQELRARLRKGGGGGAGVRA